MAKEAKQVLINMLKQDALEGRITPEKHQELYDKLKEIKEGHDILYYIKQLCES